MLLFILALWCSVTLPQVHDRDALPQPQFVVPVLETATQGSRAATPVAGKSSKAPFKAPAAKGQVPSSTVSRGQPAGLAEGPSQPVAGSLPTEYVRPWLVCLLEPCTASCNVFTGNVMHNTQMLLNILMASLPVAYHVECKTNTWNMSSARGPSVKLC